MTGRRRGRTGRGWDASPPRQARGADDDRERPRHRTGGDGASRRSGGRDGEDRAPIDPAERAREICLRQLAVRPRTRAELAATLRQRGIADEVAAEILARYGEVGMIDDRAFASAWVTSRHHGKGLARRALAVELRRKGVDDAVVGEALDDLGHETEVQTARALVERRLRTERGGHPEAVFRRLVGMLGRKGYPPGLAFRVVKEALADAREASGGGTGLDGLEDAFDVDALEAEARDEDSRRDV